MLIFLNRRWSFRISLATLVISLVVLLSGALMWVSYRESSIAAIDSAKNLFEAISGKLVEQTNSLLTSVVVLTESGSQLTSMYAPPDRRGADPRLLEFLFRALERNPNIYSVAVAY
jgi:hypothetical protein